MCYIRSTAGLRHGPSVVDSSHRTVFALHLPPPHLHVSKSAIQLLLSQRNLLYNGFILTIMIQPCSRSVRSHRLNRFTHLFGNSESLDRLGATSCSESLHVWLFRKFGMFGKSGTLDRLAASRRLCGLPTTINLMWTISRFSKRSICLEWSPLRGDRSRQINRGLTEG